MATQSKGWQPGPLTLLGAELGHHTKIAMQVVSIFSTSVDV